MQFEVSQRGEERRGEERSGACAWLLLIALPVADVAAQGAPVGTWEPGFNHQNNVSGVATDFRVLQQVTIPAADVGNPAVFFNVNGDSESMAWGWAFDYPGNIDIANPFHATIGEIGRFNAIHMALIPKGPHRGKILVWNRYPVIVRPGATLDPSGKFWSCQGWSIVDPSPLPGEPRFRNFLLPLDEFRPNPTQPPGASGDVADLFCSGHAWDANGNLIVAGGAKFSININTMGITELGARWLARFEPDQSMQAFLAAVLPLPLYDQKGRWDVGWQLHWDRYYPTVAISPRLSRVNLAEVAMIAGGTDTTATGSAVVYPPHPKNSYETWRPLLFAPQSPTFAQDSAPPLAVLTGQEPTRRRRRHPLRVTTGSRTTRESMP